MNFTTRLAASAAIVAAAVVVAGGLATAPAFAATTAPIVSGAGLHPMAVAFNSTGSTAYVVDLNGFINVVSTSTKKVTHQITTEGSDIDTNGFLTGGALSPDGKTLWVANYEGPDGPQLLGYSTSTRDLTHEYHIGGLETGAVAISPDGVTGYVWGESNATTPEATLYEVTLGTGAVTTADLGVAGDQAPSAVVVSSNSSTVYATTNTANFAKITVSGNSVDLIPLSANPQGLALSSDDGTVYIGEANGSLESYDVGADTVDHVTSVTDAQLNGVALTPTTGELVVDAASTESGTGEVFVYSTSTGDEISQTFVGSDPWAIAVSPTGTKAYVTNEDSGTTSIVTLKDAAPAISSHVATATGTVNVAYSTTWSATGFPSPTYSSTGTLPTGLTLDSVTGTLSGTPTATGVFTFKIVASNSSGKASTTKIQTVTIGLQLEAQMVGISGTPKSGQTLTASTEPWAPAPVALTYKWQRSTDGGTCTTISGATKSTYKLGSSSNHHQVRVEVTGKKTDYTTFTYKSEPVTVS
jgi:DNA-binding beta-propeller fold protein YncE